MSIQKVQVSFLSNFASIFSAIKHNSSVLSQLKHYIHLAKSSPLKCKFSRFSSARVKIRQIAHVKFELTSQFLFEFAPFFILMTHNSPVNFNLINFRLQIKGPNKIPYFQAFERALVKICQILHVILERTSQFSFKFCINLQCNQT